MGEGIKEESTFSGGKKFALQESVCPGSAGRCPDTAEEPQQLTSPILPIISTNKLY